MLNTDPPQSEGAKNSNKQDCFHADLINQLFPKTKYVFPAERGR